MIDVKFDDFGLTILLDSETIIRKLAILKIPYFMGDVRRASEDKKVFLRTALRISSRSLWDL